MLSKSSTQWAEQVCLDIADADEQWHSFLRALAMAGFEQWLNQGTTKLAITYPQRLTSGRDANIQVGDFQLCILPMGTLKDNRVAIPATAVTDKDAAAHLYVLVEVHEEVEQVRVLAGLRHDQLRQYLQQHEVNDYVVPVSEFNISPDRLLLYLNCLNPERFIPKPVKVPAVAAMDARVTEQLHRAVTTVINTGKWVNDQLDAVAEELEWQLIPSMELSYELRGAGQNRLQGEVSRMLEEIRQQGVEIPDNATGACKAVTIGDVPCEVYSLVWEVPESQEWSLFVVLGSETDGPLPAGLELRISDEDKILTQKEVSDNEAITYLYGQGFGNLDEQLIVNIYSSDGETLRLPNFRFDPKE